MLGRSTHPRSGQGGIWPLLSLPGWRSGSKLEVGAPGEFGVPRSSACDQDSRACG